MAALESARFLHQDAFKRFSAGNRSLKYLSEYMEERARIEMDYSVSLEQLAAKWNRKLADTLDFEYHDFRIVLREVFSEPTNKAPLHNKVANKIMNEATMLKKQYKDQFKREAQTAILEKYTETMGKQSKLEDRTHKAKKRYYKKKHALENVQSSIREFPYRSESSHKYQDLQQKRTSLSEQATDSYLRYESRLRVETMNRQEFLQEMAECEAAYNEQEMFRLRSVRDRLRGMLVDLETLEGQDRESCRQKLVRLQGMVRDFPIKDAINTYTALFQKDHTFPIFEDYQDHTDVKTNESAATVEYDPSLCGVDSSRDVLTGLSSQTERDKSNRPGVNSPTKSPVMAWEPEVSDDGSEGDDHYGASYRSVVIHDDDGKEATPSSSDRPDVDLNDLTNVRVVAIRPYRGKQNTELSFDVGQVIKQKLPANNEGMAYGWIRPNNFSKRRYGTYPADYVKLKPNKHKKQ